MQLTLPFSTLLAGVLVALCVQDVQAAPLQQQRSAPRMVTLPLKRMETRSPLHPHIVRCRSSARLCNM
jgi:hypothetical protein